MAPPVPATPEPPRTRILLFALLYASEGAPIGFIWWALPTLLRLHGVGIEAITSLTATLLLPWVLKFVWAPLIDLLRGPRWGYRSWIFAMQSVMAMALVPLVWLDPAADIAAWRALLLAHAMAAATQDIAIDALAIGVVPAGERGRVTGAMQAGMLTGRSVFGGGAVAVAAWLGLPWLIAILIVWILTPLAALWRLSGVAPEPDLRTAGAASGRAITGAFRTPTTWFGLGFALTSGAAFEATGQLAGPFLVDRGVEATTIGAFLGIGVVGAMMMGGLLGGVVSDRRDRRWTVAVFLMGFVMMIALLAMVDRAGTTSQWLRLALLTGMYFFVGLFTAASYALFMDLTDRRVGATQFTTFMAATNGCESWSGWTAGRLVAAEGYPTAFLVMGAVSLASLVLMRGLRPAASARG